MGWFKCLYIPFNLSQGVSENTASTEFAGPYLAC